MTKNSHEQPTGTTYVFWIGSNGWLIGVSQFVNSTGEHLGVEPSVGDSRIVLCRAGLNMHV